MLEDDTFLITEVSLSDSGLARVAGALADYGGAGTPPGQRGWLRSWVTGWTHRLDVDPRGRAQAEPIAGVGRLAEAVVDVLLERRPLEQMRRWLSRDVAGMLTASAAGAAAGSAGSAASAPAGSHVPRHGGAAHVPGGAGVGVGAAAGAGGGGFGAASPEDRRTPRFAARSMIRSVRLHQPASGIVESTVVVQDGPRVRAVALRFEQTAPLAPNPARPAQRGGGQSGGNGFNWMCTALQFT